VISEMTNTGNSTQEPQYEWVKVEYRDADGDPTLPRERIASTYNRRYEDVPHGTEIKVLVLAGYKPALIWSNGKYTKFIVYPSEDGGGADKLP